MLIETVALRTENIMRTQCDTRETASQLTGNCRFLSSYTSILVVKEIDKVIFD